MSFTITFEPLELLGHSWLAVRGWGSQQFTGWGPSSGFKVAPYECSRLRAEGQWRFPLLVPRGIKGSGISGSFQKPLTHRRA